MSQYFKRRKPISFEAQRRNEKLEVYMDTMNDLEVYEEEEPRTEAEDLGDYNYFKYSEEE